VGLARNRYYEEATPEEVKAAINRAEEDMREGRTTVETAFGGEYVRLSCGEPARCSTNLVLARADPPLHLELQKLLYRGHPDPPTG